MEVLANTTVATRLQYIYICIKSGTLKAIQWYISMELEKNKKCKEMQNRGRKEGREREKKKEKEIKTPFRREENDIQLALNIYLLNQ